MTLRIWGAGVALVLLVAGCTPAPKPSPRYVVGAPYSLGGLWSYPREDMALREQGVAAVLPRNRSGLTANGEARDPDALTAAHRTLQMPAIVTVTNLENGNSLKLRVNDRGPEQPGRIIGLSPRAATLLGVNGAAQVRVEVEGEPSRALAQGLPSTENRGPAIVAAPRGVVVAETLAPLPGTREATPRAVRALASDRAVTVADAAPAPPPERLPETVTRGPAMPGRLVAEAGTFHSPAAAQRRLASISRLGARIQQDGRGRQASYRIVLGPFATVAEADRAVAGVIAAGIPEVRLLVE